MLCIYLVNLNIDLLLFCKCSDFYYLNTYFFGNKSFMRRWYLSRDGSIDNRIQTVKKMMRPTLVRRTLLLFGSGTEN